MSNLIPKEEFEIASKKHCDENCDKLNDLIYSTSKSQILRDLAPSFSSILDNPKMQGFCPNPNHKQKSGKAFRLFKNFDQLGTSICNSCGSNSGITETLMFVNDWSRTETRKALYEYFNITFDVKRVFEICGREYKGKSQTTAANDESNVPAPRVFQPAKEFEVKDYEENKKKLIAASKKLVASSHPKGRKIIMNYLTSRGIDPHLGLKFLGGFSYVNPSEKYWYMDDDKNYKVYGEYPVLYQKILSPEGLPASFHRHYLEPEGKGGVKLMPRGMAELPKKKGMVYCQDSHGCYMPVGYTPSCESSVMGVGEGLETTLSGAIITGIPSRASSAGMLKQIHIPESVKTLVHFCDPDQAGINDGDALELRCNELGINYIRELPPAFDSFNPNPDWNDVLIRFGLERSKSFMQCLK